MVEERPGCVNVDVLLSCLVKAWSDSDIPACIVCMKLLSAAHDHEKRKLNPAGIKTLLEQTRCKPTVGLLVLSVLHRCSKAGNVRSFLYWSFKLATIPDVCVRLVI